LRDSAQPAIDALSREIEAATSAINSETTLKVDGPRATLKLAIDAVELAEERLSEKNYQSSLDACKSGGSLAKKAVQELKGLASRKREIENSLSKLEEVDVSRILTKFDTVVATTRQTYGKDSVASAPVHRATVTQKIAERRIAIASAKSAVTIQDWERAEQQIEVARKATSSINYAVNTIEDLRPAIIRQRQAIEAENRRPSYPSAGHSHHSPKHVTQVTNNYGSDDPGFGSGLATGILGTLAVESILDGREERREHSSWGGGRSSDDDSGFGGASIQTNRDDDSDRGFGGESIDTSSSNDDNGFSSNND
jgi:hypothetical protein